MNTKLNFARVTVEELETMRAAAETLSSTITAILGAPADRPMSDAPVHAKVETADSNGTTERKTPTRTASTLYVAVKNPAKKALAGLGEGSMKVTFDAINKAPKGLSNKQIEDKTGLKMKTVQSAVWHLRHANLVKSVAAE